MGYTRKTDKFDPVFSFKDGKGLFYETRGYPSCNFFSKDGFSTELWNFALVVIPCLVLSWLDRGALINVDAPGCGT